MAGSEILPSHSNGPGVMHLGTLAPNEHAIEPLRRIREAYVSEIADTVPEGQQIVLWRKYGMMPFRQYLAAVRNYEKWRRELRRTDTLDSTKLTSDLRAFLLGIYDEEFHSPDLQGWVNYLCTVTPLMADEIAKISTQAKLREADREMHTLITAGTGWGKSELMKALIYHYVWYKFAAVVVLDPHGDMAGQIARFREFDGDDRLIYIEPGLQKGLTVGLNPLDGRGLSAEGCALFAAQLATAFGEIVADLTPNMQTLARNCLRILLEERNATLLDLVKMLAPRPKRGGNRPDDPRRMALVAKGRQHRDPIVSDFFKVDLEAESFDSAKAALRNRISSLLSIQSWAAMTCGPSTVHLQSALDDRKILLVNLGPLGSEGGAAMGRLIVSMVAAIGRRREGTPVASRVPCHVFVDEASTMVSPAMGRILAELRKYAIHLTLAQQVGGAGFDEGGRRVLAANTACKIVGSNNRGDLRTVFGDADVKDVPKIPRGSFWVRWGWEGEPQCIRIRSDLADEANAMTPQEWQGVRVSQIGRYYREARALAEVLPSDDRAGPGASESQPQATRPEKPGLDLPLE